VHGHGHGHGLATRGLLQRGADIVLSDCAPRAPQVLHDADLTRRGPEVDADLTRKQREALADLQSAVGSGDLAAALAAWRREAAARYAQRSWRTAWRRAYDRTGEGATPPHESTRDAERDEAAGFLPRSPVPLRWAPAGRRRRRGAGGRAPLRPARRGAAPAPRPTCSTPLPAPTSSAPR
jgi:hypothetical protein